MPGFSPAKRLLSDLKIEKRGLATHLAHPWGPQLSPEGVSHQKMTTTTMDRQNLLSNFLKNKNLPKSAAENQYQIRMKRPRALNLALSSKQEKLGLKRQQPKRRLQPKKLLRKERGEQRHKLRLKNLNKNKTNLRRHHRPDLAKHGPRALLP